MKRFSIFYTVLGLLLVMQTPGYAADPSLQAHFEELKASQKPFVEKLSKIEGKCEEGERACDHKLGETIGRNSADGRKQARIMIRQELQRILPDETNLSDKKPKPYIEIQHYEYKKSGNSSPKNLRGQNILFHIPATINTDQFILLGGHYDTIANQSNGTSYNPRVLENKAPGADDNGSGVALLIAAADALSDVNFRNKHVVIAFFDQEENPGRSAGSHAFAKDLKKTGRVGSQPGSNGEPKEMHSAHIFDTVGVSNNSVLALEMRCGEAGSAEYNAYKTALAEITESVRIKPHGRLPAITFETAPCGLEDGETGFLMGSSDYRPLRKQGYPAVGIVESLRVKNKDGGYRVFHYDGECKKESCAKELPSHPMHTSRDTFVDDEALALTTLVAIETTKKLLGGL